LKLYYSAATLAALFFPLQAAELFPLQEGNLWTYRGATSGEGITISVGTPFIIGGNVYHVLRGYTPLPVFARYNDRNELVYRDEEQDREVLLTAFAPTGDQWWNAPARACAQEGSAAPDRVAYQGPAGRIPDVTEVTFRPVACAGRHVVSEQFAGNIGMIRRVVATADGGAETFDLMYARIGKLFIESDASTAFSVSVFNSIIEDGLPVMLRLRSTPGSPRKLTFPSSQEYDIVVRDPRGKIVWRWSEGQFFTANLHERQIGRDWQIPARIPRSVLPEEVEARAGYIIQAWLTTAGELAEFASTIALQ